MREQLRRAGPLGRVRLQREGEEVLRVRGEALHGDEVGVAGLGGGVAGEGQGLEGDHVGDGVCEEGLDPREDLVDEHPQAPDVGFLVVGGELLLRHAAVQDLRVCTGPGGCQGGVR